MPICILLALLLAGCGGGQQQYFRLSAIGPATVRDGGLGVGVGPVTLPAYVDRAELVFQSGDNEFQVPANAHWTGSLQGNVTQTLAEDLGRRLGSGNVAPSPWPANTPMRFQVIVNIGQFHAISGSGAILDVSWQVADPATHAVLRRRNAHLEEKVDGDGYAAVVAAESRLLDQLAAQIATSLRGI
jgi:uncharacterized lipoprotein YmbA